MSEIIGRLVGKEPQFVSEKKKANNLIGDISNMSKKLTTPTVKFKDGIKDLI
jgi:hypothetical protein